MNQTVGIKHWEIFIFCRINTHKNDVVMDSNLLLLLCGIDPVENLLDYWIFFIYKAP